MQRLRETDILILKSIGGANEQGMTPEEILTDVSLSAQNLNRYLKKLQGKGHLSKDVVGRLHYYKLTPKGKDTLVRWVSDPNPKPFIKPIPTPAQSRPTTPDTTHTQQADLHRAEIHCFLAKTSYRYAKDILDWHKIPYRVCGRGGSQILISWTNGITIKLTSKHLIAYALRVKGPIMIPGVMLQDEMVTRTMKEIRLFTDTTRMQVMRTVTGAIAFMIPRREVAITSNELAGKLPQGKWLEMAYDKITDACSIWLDQSHPFSWETSKLANYERLAAFTQGIDDGVIDPFNDEMRTRRDIDKLTQVAGRLLESEKAIRGDISYIARNLSTHIPFMDYTLKTARGTKARKPEQMEKNQRRLL